jgi:tetratricopeptide (TPR) repeat protein
MSTTHRRLYEILDHKASVLLGSGQLEEANRVARKALELAERGYGPGDAQVILALQKLGDIYTEMDNSDEARVEYERALRIANQVRPDDYELVTRLTVRMASLNERIGNRNHAVHYYEQAVKNLESSNALNTLFAARVTAGIAQYYRGIGSEKKAVEAFGKALEAFQGISMKSFRNKEVKANILTQYGRLLTRLEDFPQAEKMQLEALRLRTEIYGDSHRETGKSRANLATIYNALGEFAEAEIYYGQALTTLEEFLPEAAEDYEDVAASYADVLRRLGKRREASQVSKRLNTVQRERSRMEKAARKSRRKAVDDLLISGGKLG